jgi:serine/threonine protein kinase
MSDEDKRKEMLNILNIPSHPNIVEFIGIAMVDNEWTIFSEYLEGGSLPSLLKREKRNSPVYNEATLKTLIRISAQISEGMSHLHRHNMVHRDLASRNIMLTAQLVPKVGDFGLSRFTKDSYRPSVIRILLILGIIQIDKHIIL